MTAEIGKTRYGCNLQGALSTLEAVEAVVPIIHGTAGLGIQSFAANKSGNGIVGSINGYSVPSTNMYEKQIVFGGGSRLREQIKNTVRVIEGQLYVVLSGVESEMISDDVVAMTQEITDQGYAAAYYKAPGFRGHARTGYEEVVAVLLDQIAGKAPKQERETKSVNIFGIIPQQDLYWQGNLREIQRIMGSLGVKTNRLFGDGEDWQSWQSVPAAALNVVVSKWGVKAAENLRSTYGTPYVFIENPGLGPDTDNFVEIVGEQLGISKNVVDNFLYSEKKKFDYVIRQFAEYYYSYDFRRKISVIGEESKVIRYGEFLKKYLGMQIKTAVITDYEGDSQEQQPVKSLEKIISDIVYSDDTERIEEKLGPDNEIIFGSELEAGAAARLNAELFVIGNPQNRELAVSGVDIGYAGAIALIEKISRIGRGI
ncbi:nitrogenase component 1 [Pectinatus haikarae]|uniref:Nitrogenase molybdenum-iron protein beta chain n=1 Tax=Pectinatus haikarae TaxID=349096 RepID=A0ABT9Y9H5_9FIRM|nr:nitrogenase component 1 [Pectinatus haikarae]MDQ0204488.1 nitrogenase molybdenum-iron protein beta chain [Pectinatus haikarae]